MTIKARIKEKVNEAKKYINMNEMADRIVSLSNSTYKNLMFFLNALFYSCLGLLAINFMIVLITYFDDLYLFLIKGISIGVLVFVLLFIQRKINNYLNDLNDKL